MIKVHRVQSFMRAQGAPWDVIDQGLSQAQQEHLASGGDYWDMVAKMGFGDPQIMRDRLAIEAQMAKANGSK